MDFFDSLVLNILFLLFPICVYLIYIAHSNNNKTEQNDIMLSLSNITSVYLMIKFSKYFDHNCLLLLINVPLIISFFKKRTTASILIAISIVLYYYFRYNLNIGAMILEYLLYIFLFSYLFAKEKGYEFILNGFTFIKGVILSIEIIYILPRETNFYVVLLQIFVILITFYIVSNLVFLLASKAEEIILLNNALKDLKKEKTLKNALFKVTHEIKNPLAVCMGYLSMMNYNNMETVEKYNNIIKSELGRTLTIMDDFGDYNKLKVDLAVMDLGILLEETISSMNSLFKSNNIKIESNIEDEYIINGDYNRLKQVLVNLFKNSVEATTENGLIKVKINEVKDNIILEITDNGMGMTKEELALMVELFYTTKEKGSGLGVSVSMEILKLHNGEMIYESLENIGTTVKVLIPKYIY